MWKALIAAAKAADAKNLILRGCTAIKDIAPLADLNLQKLYLTGTGVSDLTPLGALTNLQMLALSVTGESDLTPLGALTNLQVLVLSVTGDWPPLDDRTNLQVFFLSMTAISKEQILWLREQLPQAQIICTGSSQNSFFAFPWQDQEYPIAKVEQK